MKIGIEIGWAHKAGGARRVAFNTLLEMSKLRPDYEFHTFLNTHISQLDKQNITQHVLNTPNYLPQAIWDQFVFPHYATPKAISKFNLDVVHFTNNIVPLKCKTPYVVTIHDMTPFVIPNSFKALHGAYQRYYFKIAARNSKKIITVSQNSKKDICRILGVDEQKIEVIPLAPLQIPSSGIDNNVTLPEYMQAPFILYVGAIHPRKNVPKLIKAFAQLKKEKKMPHKLIIAGARRWGNNDINSTIEQMSISNEIVFPGRVSDQELNLLYKNCCAFVYPSIYEGFGLPVIEAMAQGAPVVTSQGSSLEEVAGGAAELIDPYSDTDLKRGLEKVVMDDSYADELRKKGISRAKEFSWKKTAEKLINTLESI